MAETGQDFEMYQRTNFDLIVPITKKIDGSPLDLTGASITWALRQRMKSTSNLIMKTTPSQITVSGNTLTVHLIPSDTTTLVGSFFHECKMTDSNGLESELFTGSATILFSNL